MPRQKETPATLVAGASGGSQRTDTPISEQLQHLSARHHVRHALLETLATAAWGGDRG